MTRAHPLLSREAVIFEDYTGELASLTDATLRKHGREIAEMQYVQRRIAEVAMDLYGIAACLARTTRAIERRGDEGARREIDMTMIFTNMAHKRLRQHVSDFQKNDDELRKAVAVRAYADRAYPFDVL
jgi:acyl-CoA dehydrogenase family protein 9